MNFFADYFSLGFSAVEATLFSGFDETVQCGQFGCHRNCLYMAALGMCLWFFNCFPT